MILKSISDLNRLKLIDKATDTEFYGCNQEWYHDEWQRRRGCGPIAACNILMYLNIITSEEHEEKSINTKENILNLMEEAWSYVTPSEEGIPCTKKFSDLFHSYIKSKRIDMKSYILDIPEDKGLRPDFSKVYEFLNDALIKDKPIAFLNLCNGEEENLVRYHWVIIVSMENEEDKDSIFVSILDGGEIKKIDLTLWHKTTTRGGGFVYFFNE